MGFLRTFFGFVLAACLITFAVANRQIIPLVYSPIHDPLEIPLYMITLGFLAGGFLLGSFVVWMNGASTRRTGRKQRKTIKSLEKELSTLQNQTETAKAPPSDFFPALPKSTEDKTALPARENSSIK